MAESRILVRAMTEELRVMGMARRARVSRMERLSSGSSWLSGRVRTCLR